MTVTAVAQRKEAKRVGAEHGQADQADLQRPTLHVPVHPVRFVTAAALFDGHDAAINIMRRILQAQGAEVVHLGHDRSVRQVADAVLEEDAQGVAVSSYQGGHVEYFEFLAATLKAAGAGDVRIFGGGGGVIVPEEIARLNAAGVKIFSPEDGQRLGLTGMINELIRDCDTDLTERPPSAEAVLTGDRSALARAITCLQAGRLPDGDVSALTAAAASRRVPVLGITGTGGSGKSSLTDELVRRFRTDQNDKLRVAVLAVDPTRRRGGGALLGDRIRMNALDGERVFFRSLATRGARELPENMEAIIAACQAASYDLVIVETPGIGQGDAGVTGLADVALYVMTPEFGAASQLEKIDMLDFADVVAINKFERRGGADALRDVSRQLIRNRGAFGARPDDMPVFGTSAATFNDNGVTALYQHLAGLLEPHGLPLTEGVLPPATGRVSTDAAAIIPPARAGYLGEIAAAVRGYHEQTEKQVAAVRRVQRLADVRAELLGGIERTGATQVPNPTLNPATTATPTTTATPATSTTSTSPATSHHSHQSRRARRARRRGAPRPGRRRRHRRQRRADQGLARRRRVLLRRRAGGQGPRPRAAHEADPRVPVRQQDPPGGAAALRRPRRAAAVPAGGEPARVLPVHGRGVPVQARRARTRPGCSPGRATRSAPTAGSSWCRRDSPRPGCRPRSTPSPCTAATRGRAPTSTARSARPASRSRRWTT